MNKYIKERGLELGACVLIQLAASVPRDLRQVILSGTPLPCEQLDLAVGDLLQSGGCLARG